MVRAHTGGSAVQAAHVLVRSGLFRTVLIVGAERIAETPDAQKVLHQTFTRFTRKRCRCRPSPPSR